MNYDPDKHFSDTVDEDVVVHNMKFYLTPAPTSDITVKYFWSCIPVCNGSRARKTSELTAGDDYTLPKTVTARKGSTTANIPLTITGDSNPEPIESLRLYWGRVGVDGETAVSPSVTRFRVLERASVGTVCSPWAELAVGACRHSEAVTGPVGIGAAAHVGAESGDAVPVFNLCRGNPWGITLGSCATPRQLANASLAGVGG